MGMIIIPGFILFCFLLILAAVLMAKLSKATTPDKKLILGLGLGLVLVLSVAGYIGWIGYQLFTLGH